MTTRFELVFAFQETMWGDKKAIVQANIYPDEANPETDLKVLALAALDGVHRPLAKSGFHVETSIMAHRPDGDKKLAGLKKQVKKEKAT